MPIENLVEDVLLEIFKLLDKDSLINAHETCQRWADVIDDNPGFYKDMELIISEKTKDSLEKNGKLKYQKIRVLSFPNSRIETIKAILDYNKHNVKFVDFQYCPWEFFIQNVVKLKHLEKLTFDLCYSTPQDRSFIMKFPELKELKVMFPPKFNLENFQIIAPKLEKLDIYCERLIGKSLKRFPNMKSLSYFKYNKPNKLVLNYLASKRDGLQDLKIWGSVEELKIVLSKIIVEHLDTYIHRIIRLDGIVNTSVKKLTLNLSTLMSVRRDPQGISSFDEILKACPNVENVIIQSYFHFDAFDIIAKYQKVQHVTIKFALARFPEKINLSSILSLSINIPESLNFAELLNLLLSCENLKRINVKYGGLRLTDVFIKIVLENSPKLEEFQTDNSILLSENLVEYLKKGNFKLKKLKIQTNFSPRQNLAEIYKTQRELADKLNRESKIKCVLLTPEDAGEQLCY